MRDWRQSKSEQFLWLDLGLLPIVVWILIASVKCVFEPLHTSPLMRILDRSRICSLVSGSVRLARRGLVVQECGKYLERGGLETHA